MHAKHIVPTYLKLFQTLSFQKLSNLQTNKGFLFQFGLGYLGKLFTKKIQSHSNGIWPQLSQSPLLILA